MIVKSTNALWKRLWFCLGNKTIPFGNEDFISLNPTQGDEEAKEEKETEACSTHAHRQQREARLSSS